MFELRINNLFLNILDSEFQDWENRQGGTADADFSIFNNAEVDGVKAAKIDVNSIGQNSWDIQLKRTNIQLELAHEYELSFSIKADQANLPFSYGRNESVTNSGVFNASGIVNTQWQRIRKTFTANTTNSIYLFINLSHATGNYYVDHVVLRKVCETDERDPPVFDLLVSNLNDIGPNSLKEAISCASDGAIITLNNVLSDYNLFIQDSPIVIDKNLTIESNATSRTFLNATNVDRIFRVNPGVTLIINNINLVGGQANTGNVIWNNGTVILEGVEVFNCLINPNPENPRLGGDGIYTLAPNVIIHK